MFNKTRVVAAAAVMALAMIAAGCGKAEKSSITMDLSDDKKAVVEFNNAKADEFVMGGYIRVEEGEGIEVVSDLNDGGKVLIGFIAVPDDQSADELPDTETAKYEMMISGAATQGCTAEPGDYDLKITVQGKADGTVTLKIRECDACSSAVWEWPSSSYLRRVSSLRGRGWCRSRSSCSCVRWHTRPVMQAPQRSPLEFSRR